VDRTINFLSLSKLLLFRAAIGTLMTAGGYLVGKIITSCGIPSGRMDVPCAFPIKYARELVEISIKH
jgi:hypothetical protein